MRFEVTIEGKKMEVEVDLHPEPRLLVDGREVPVTVVDSGGTRLELELSGQKYVVEGKRTGAEEPGHESWVLAINGEGFPVSAVVTAGSEGAPVAQENLTGAPASVAAAGEGVIVTPPMPGKILEVRVSEGDEVKKGTPLLILEAMKMKNEITSPVDGIVRDLKAAAGKNVKSKEVLLRIVERSG
jgi:biotin carboxyl carrier protein